MGQPCPEVDEAHTCAFCEEHLALDFSKVNGSISPTRLEQMQNRLLQVGFLGRNESLYDDKYEVFRKKLEDYHIYDMNLNLFWSEVADACPLAERARKRMGQRKENDEHYLVTARIQRNHDYEQDIVSISYHNVKIEPETCPFQIGWRLKWSHERVLVSDGDDMGSVLRMEIMADQGSVAAREFPRRAINHHPLEHTLEHARGWLESCLRDHPESSDVPKYIPKRLLEISRSLNGSSCVTVVDGSTPVAYAALSYKWGGIHEPRLTRARLNRAAASALQFDLEVLPKTIADAVKVTQAFGINHLWVDALCIIQDDDSDKAREVGQMSQIYSQATVTILASRSNSASEGFLHCRHGRECRENAEKSYLSRWDFRLPYRTFCGEQGSIIITEQDLDRHHQEPLDTRAWAFQEQLLSPHIISYGALRTVFDCLRITPAPPWQSEKNYAVKFSDDGNIKLRRKLVVKTLIRRDLHDVLYKPYMGSDHSSNRWGRDHDRPMGERAWDIGERLESSGTIYNRRHHDAMDLWQGLLSSYANRGLTNPQDRLNGFAAVAEAFARYLKDEYVAGFWRSDLLATLTWGVGWRPQKQQTEYCRGTRFHPQKRPTEYCGPTWSWASIVQPAGHSVYPGSSFRWDRNLLILDCQAKLVDESTKFGAVSSGFLKVTGKIVHGTIGMCPCCVGRDSFPTDLDPYWVSLNWPTEFEPEGRVGWEDLEYHYQPDALEQDFLEGDNCISVVVLIVGFNTVRPICRCLVLREASGGVYTRLGVLHISQYGGEYRHRDTTVPKYSLCIYDELWDQAFPVETLTII